MLKTYEKHAFCGELQVYTNEILSPGAVTALPLTAATLALDANRPAVRAWITVEDQSIRYWVDGTTPTASVGHLVNAEGTIEIEGIENLKRFKAISTSGTA